MCRDTPPLAFPELPQDFFVAWFRERGRAFPWRKPGTSPYGILVAEMLLRQTRAEMVASVWSEFVARYPDPHSLDAAPTKELYKLVRCLGFGVQRVTALKAIARALVVRHGGSVPDTVEELEALPHIGPYAARAVCCFAYGQPVPVVDSNVLRLFSRLAGWHLPRDIRRRKAGPAWEVPARLLPNEAAQEHNYGVLDFAAEVCRPVRPRCENCPLSGCCRYFEEHQRGSPAE